MHTPEHYQKELTVGAGLNPYGEPNLLLVWGRDPIVRKGAPAQRLSDEFECWCLVMWQPAEEFGPPELWPRDMGPYPSRGQYVIVQAFKYSGNVARLDSPVLCPRVLRLAAKVITDNRESTLATRAKVIDGLLSSQQKEWADKIDDIVRDAAPLGEVVSFAGQKNCNSVIQQKMDQIERCMKMRKLARLQMPRPGFRIQKDAGSVMQVPA